MSAERCVHHWHRFTRTRHDRSVVVRRCCRCGEERQEEVYHERSSVSWVHDVGDCGDAEPYTEAEFDGKLREQEAFDAGEAEGRRATLAKVRARVRASGLRKLPTVVADIEHILDRLEAEGVSKGGDDG